MSVVQKILTKRAANALLTAAGGAAGMLGFDKLMDAQKERIAADQATVAAGGVAPVRAFNGLLPEWLDPKHGASQSILQTTAGREAALKHKLDSATQSGEVAKAVQSGWDTTRSTAADAANKVKSLASDAGTALKGIAGTPLNIGGVNTNVGTVAGAGLGAGAAAALLYALLRKRRNRKTAAETYEVDPKTGDMRISGAQTAPEPTGDEYIYSQPQGTRGGGTGVAAAAAGRSAIEKLLAKATKPSYYNLGFTANPAQLAGAGLGTAAAGLLLYKLLNRSKKTAEVAGMGAEAEIAKLNQPTPEDEYIYSQPTGRQSGGANMKRWADKGLSGTQMAGIAAGGITAAGLLYALLRKKSKPAGNVVKFPRAA